MPVTINTNRAVAAAWKQTPRAASADELFQKSCSDAGAERRKGIVQSSFGGKTLQERAISPSANGFVYSMLYGYSHHHHVTIRPEDVWFAILVQLNFYINAHAEELRSVFVAHEGQEALKVVRIGDRYTVDFGEMAEEMTHLMQEKIVDPDLREWFAPDFTTTTDSDRVIGAVLMMGGLQSYFTYSFGCTCGFPSITLLGEKDDWERIAARLDKMDTFGDEAAHVATLLRPILKRFAASFDDPANPAIHDFWNRAIDRHQGSGIDYISGWMTAFCFWDSKGRPLYAKRTARGWLEMELDGAVYCAVKTKAIPVGYASVPVTVDDNGSVLWTRMVAGSVGIQAMASGTTPQATRPRGSISSRDYGFPVDEDFSSEDEEEEGLNTPTSSALAARSDVGDAAGWSSMLTTKSANEGPLLDSIQPVSGWWMYEVEPET